MSLLGVLDSLKTLLEAQQSILSNEDCQQCLDQQCQVAMWPLKVHEWTVEEASVLIKKIKEGPWIPPRKTDLVKSIKTILPGQAAKGARPKQSLTSFAYLTKKDEEFLSSGTSSLSKRDLLAHRLVSLGLTLPTLQLVT